MEISIQRYEFAGASHCATDEYSDCERDTDIRNHRGIRWQACQ